MARYRKVDPRIWNDAKFRSLSDNGKLAFFFLLTHPHMTAIGAMRSSIPGLAAEIGWSSEAFAEAFHEATRKGMAEHDEKASLIWLPNFVRYNQPESPNVVKAWASSLEMLPECGLLNRVVAGAVAFAQSLNKGFVEALPEAFSKGIPYQEQEQEQEQEQDKNRFAPPASPAAPPKKPPRFNMLMALCEQGVSDRRATEFLEVRKAKRAVNTQTALDGIVREAGKAGISVDDAVRICIEKGWQGFDASWNWQADAPKKTQRQINDEATAQALFGSSRQAAEKVITGEVVQ